MSQTFSLVCHETKQKLWVGQGWGAMTCFYGEMPDVMFRLGRFLEATRGRSLVLVCNDTDGFASSDYEEFEEPEAQ